MPSDKDDFSKYQHYILEKLKHIEKLIEETRIEIRDINDEYRNLLIKTLQNEKEYAVSRAINKTYYATFAAIFGFVGALVVPLMQYIVESLKK